MIEYFGHFFDTVREHREHNIMFNQILSFFLNPKSIEWLNLNKYSDKKPSNNGKNISNIF